MLFVAVVGWLYFEQADWEGAIGKVKTWRPAVEDELECSAQNGLVSDSPCGSNVVVVPVSGGFADKYPLHTGQDFGPGSSLGMKFFGRIGAFAGFVHRRRKDFHRRKDLLSKALVHIALEDSPKQNHNQRHQEFRA